MGVNRTVVAVAMFAMIAVTAARADAEDPPGQRGAGGVEAEAADEVPCAPVATIWPTSASGPGRLQAPRLSVVTTDLRPKDAVVLLDGRVVGRGRYFNGKKGFLYLEPGRYRLELEIDGYRPEAFTIVARPGCRFDIRHRLERARGAAARAASAEAGKGEPTRWIWEPVDGGDAPAAVSSSRGPDPSLRPDLAVSRQPPQPRASEGSLRLRVGPPGASVYLDGSYLASAREIGLMVSPMAIPSGQHVVEITAPGFASRSQEIDVIAGELIELELELDRENSEHSSSDF
jgi:hypothetical protein